MNVGQLGWVKLLPKPPSKGSGNDALALGALTIEVVDPVEVEAVEGATTDEGDPVSVDVTALAVEEKVGLSTADEAGVEEVVEGELREAPKRSPFCRR